MLDYTIALFALICKFFVIFHRGRHAVEGL